MVVCVAKPYVPGLTTGGLDDTVVVFIPDEVAETTTDLDICSSFSAMTQVKIHTSIKEPESVIINVVKAFLPIHPLCKQKKTICCFIRRNG